MTKRKKTPVITKSEYFKFSHQLFNNINQLYFDAVSGEGPSFTVPMTGLSFIVMDTMDKIRFPATPQAVMKKIHVTVQEHQMIANGQVTEAQIELIGQMLNRFMQPPGKTAGLN
jgi:hypothetical protein